jgi:SAM-dependent methyltransferase
MPEAFDDFAETYELAVQRSVAFARVEREPFIKRRMEVLLELVRSVGQPAGLRVLDVGCGTGAAHRYLSSLVGELHGVDVSEQMVARAARENAIGEYRVYDGKTLPFNDCSLDVAFAVGVFHHVVRGERPRLAAEMGRVLRSGGMVAIFENNPWNPVTRLAVHKCEFDNGVELLRARESVRLLQGARLAAIKSRFIFFSPLPAPTLDRLLARVPAGAQYAVFASKP